MILTITLNPALDKTLTVENFKYDDVNNVFSTVITAGGKGINVSKIAHRLGGDTLAVALTGSSSGDELSNLLKKESIKHDFINQKSATRTNTKVLDLVEKTTTDLNEQGKCDYSQGDLFTALCSKIDNYVSNSADIIVLSGSLPKGLDSSIYAKIINKYGKNFRILLDTKGDALRLALDENPYMIKPNISELAEMLGKPLNSIDDAILAVKNDIPSSIPLKIISMGSNGALIITADKTLHAKALKIVPYNTVGAGDSLVGAFSTALFRGDNLEDAIRYAVASSAFQVAYAHEKNCTNEEIKKLSEQVEIVSL